MSALPDAAVPVAILFALLALAYLGMWRGWRSRASRHDLPPLPELSADADRPEPEVTAAARYFGTTVSGSWLERVTAQGLGPRSTARLALSADGLDVARDAGSFRIPAAALRGARLDQGIAGKVVPPHGVLVVTWQHGDLLLDTGFRLEPPREARGATITETHEAWVRSISTIVRDHKEHSA